MAALCALLAMLPAAAASQGRVTMRDARMTVAFVAGACEVSSRFVVDTPEPAIVEHRLMLDPQASASEFAVIGSVAGHTAIVGRTARLPISLVGSGRNEYSVRYRVTAKNGLLDRCPLLVPSAPTDGLRRSVTIEVDLPADAKRLPGDFPALAWHGPHGEVMLNHVPSFVRAPHVGRGDPPGWRESLDVRRLVDVSAVVTIVLSTAAWMVLRRRTT